MFSEKHKKEMPLLGMFGMGGGVASNLVGGPVPVQFLLQVELKPLRLIYCTHIYFIRITCGC